MFTAIPGWVHSDWWTEPERLPPFLVATTNWHGQPGHERGNRFSARHLCWSSFWVGLQEPILFDMSLEEILGQLFLSITRSCEVPCVTKKQSFKGQPYHSRKRQNQLSWLILVCGLHRFLVGRAFQSLRNVKYGYPEASWAGAKKNISCVTVLSSPPVR